MGYLHPCINKHRGLALHAHSGHYKFGNIMWQIVFARSKQNDQINYQYFIQYTYVLKTVFTYAVMINTSMSHILRDYVYDLQHYKIYLLGAPISCAQFH